MEHFQELSSTKIFSSATEFECQAMMFCFKTRFKQFNRNEKIISQGEKMEDLVMIVKGGAIVQHIDTLGDISILLKMKKGDMYGLESAYSGEVNYLDTLIATEKTLVLFMNKHRVINPCVNRCKRHDIVAKHVMQIVAENNIELLNKINHMSKKTIREKLLSYFNSIAKKENSKYFEIPFNKTELANYLSVDRSAMCTELKKMSDDGLIDFDKKSYHLI